MEELKRHEQFEMEVLKRLFDAGLLRHLIFGGGTCLRLCFGLSRYSVDLDFWLSGFTRAMFSKMKKILAAHYEVTDHKSKFYSYLLEIRSPDYPKRLKIEIRKKIQKRPQVQLSIAYSFFSNLQVQVVTFTLRQMWQNKVAALLERHEIRDAYDLEFIYKKGEGDLKNLSVKKRKILVEALESFTKQEIKVKLGSLLPQGERRYYNERRFALLINALK